MDIIQLSEVFYEKYSSCPEILKKENRPYLAIILKIESITFAIPFRSHIKHKYAFWTDKENGCGLDFTKAVVISSYEEIGKTNVQIRQNEFNVIKKKDYEITKKFKTFLTMYKKALYRLDVNRNRILINNSSLQYFLDKIL